MPTLSDDMYCSEQICIPPSFPYLLRQYAKAAIRTQPTDLLSWSTAYFRCLSLNIPPPVKPRLEYPIPRDHKGITPGWLKALYYQLQNNSSISFKILWDRWMGACLQHNTLIQLLCLGGFEDPLAIPWLRFIALCAGTLTDDLTHTMILICEILTEEPEGASSMIPLEIFLDLYEFLAKIDASQDQNLKNYYFRDSLLSLWREKVEKRELKEEVKEEVEQADEHSLASKSSSETMIDDKVEDADKVISCPSLPQDDQYSIEHLVIKEAEVQEKEPSEIIEIEPEGTQVHEEEPLDYKLEENVNDFAYQKESEEEFEEVFRPEESEADIKLDSDLDQVEDKPQSQEIQNLEEPDDIYIKAEDLDSHGEDEEDTEVPELGKEESTTKVSSEILDAKELDKDQIPAKQGEDAPTAEEEIIPYESVDTITELPVRNLDLVFEDEETLKEDLERLRAIQQELAGETDEELEKFKCRLIAEMPLTESQEEGIKHFATDGKLDEHSSEEKLRVISEETTQVIGDSVSETDKQTQQEYDDVFVEAIPGIGGNVSDQLIQVVKEYMKNCAKNQHGMVMPRNIRHYSCPPLEVILT